MGPSCLGKVSATLVNLRGGSLSGTGRPAVSWMVAILSTKGEDGILETAVTIHSAVMMGQRAIWDRIDELDSARGQTKS